MPTRHARAPGDPSRQEWIALLIRLELRRGQRRWQIPPEPIMLPLEYVEFRGTVET